MELKLLQDNGQLGIGIATSSEVFGRDYNETLAHQVAIAYRASARSGNRRQKDRREVKHTTKRPWHQKGTGHARAGMSSSSLQRGDGHTFPNSPGENFLQKVNEKMYHAGMRPIYSQLAREGRINVVDNLSADASRTRLLIDKFRVMGLNLVFVITDSLDENPFLASHNLAYVLVVEPCCADPLSPVHYKKVLMTKTAVTQIEELLR